MSTNDILARRRQALLDSGVDPARVDAMVRPSDTLQSNTTGNYQGGLIGNDGIALDSTRQGLLGAGIDPARINATMQSVDAGVYDGMTDAQIKERTDLLRGGGFSAGWDSTYLGGEGAKALSGGGSTRDYGLTVEQVMDKNNFKETMRPEEYAKLRDMLYASSGQQKSGLLNTNTPPNPTTTVNDGRDSVDEGSYNPGGLNGDGGIKLLGDNPNTASDYTQKPGLSFYTNDGSSVDYSSLFLNAVVGGGSGPTIRNPR
jgi:hypothetical protein